MSKQQVCAENPSNAEYTLCGDAFDSYESGDNDHKVVMAEIGEMVTCEKCRAIIKHCKTFKRFRRGND